MTSRDPLHLGSPVAPYRKRRRTWRVPRWIALVPDAAWLLIALALYAALGFVIPALVR